MADKAIPELDAVHISELPPLPELYDEDLLAVSQQNIAKKMTGAQWKEYAKASVADYVESAKDSAEKAAKSESNAAISERNAKRDADRAQMYSGKPPVIIEGNWYTWDADAQQYKDTGEPARGNLMYAVFWVDLHGDLYMYTDDEYTGPGFRLNNGDLEVVLDAGRTS